MGSVTVPDADAWWSRKIGWATLDEQSGKGWNYSNYQLCRGKMKTVAAGKRAALKYGRAIIEYHTNQGRMEQEIIYIGDTK